MKKGNIKKIIVITAVVLIAAAIATVCACAGSASAGKNAAADKNLASDYAAPVVTKVSSDDNKDVYRVQFSDGGYFEFTVTNGREGKSAYELYAEQFGYEGGEKQWLDDLLNGRLAGQKETCTVAFDSAGGSDVPSLTVEKGEKILAPEEPQRENYTFKGWFVGDEEWIFCGFPVTENMVLTAKWTENYTIGLQYVDVGNGLSVSGATGGDENIVVPSAVNGAPVVAVESRAFAGSDRIKSVTLPKSVKIIKKEAFSGCNALEEINLGGVEKIESRAFYGCDALRNLTVPDCVTDIGEEAFAACGDIREMTFGKAARSFGRNAFSGTTAKTLVVNGVAEWCASFFDGGNSHPVAGAEKVIMDGRSDALIVPDGVLSVPDYAFSGWKSAKSLSLPDSLTGIGASAFEGWESLLTLTVPDGVTALGEKAFSGCGALTSLSLGAALEKFPLSAFNAAYMLKNIAVSPDNDIYYADGNNIITKAGSVLVMGCSGSSAAENVAEIGANAFANALFLTTAPLLDGVRVIGENAFSGCANLISVTLPQTLEKIGENAFSGCRKLIEVINLSPLPVKKYSPEHGGVAYYAKAVLSAAEESRLTRSDDGLWFYRDVQETALVGYDGTQSALSLPERWESGEYYIYEYAFYKNPIVTDIVVPSGITSVEKQAFYGCPALESVEIYGVEWIGAAAFRECAALKKADIGKTETLCDEAFMNCGALEEVQTKDALKSVGARAFYGCGKIKSVVLPACIGDIGADAFGECPCLERIVYTGTCRQWESVSLCPGWAGKNPPVVECEG